jgi:hypothetical protein
MKSVDPFPSFPCNFALRSSLSLQRQNSQILRRPQSDLPPSVSSRGLRGTLYSTQLIKGRLPRSATTECLAENTRSLGGLGMTERRGASSPGLRRIWLFLSFFQREMCLKYPLRSVITPRCLPILTLPSFPCVLAVRPAKCLL